MAYATWDRGTFHTALLRGTEVELHTIRDLWLQKLESQASTEKTNTIINTSNMW